MRRLRFRFAAAHVSHAAAGVFFRIAVQNFPPKTRRRDADPIADTWHRREIANYKHDVLRRYSLAQERKDARRMVIGIDPFEASGITIQFV